MATVGHLLLVPVPAVAVLFLAHVVVAQRSVDEQDREVDRVKVPANMSLRKEPVDVKEQTIIPNFNLRRHDETVTKL